MKWALTDGQKFAPRPGYAPLPQAVVDLEKKALLKIKPVDGPTHRRSPSVPTIFCFASGRVRLPLLILDRRRHRLRARPAVVAVDSEIRLAILADRHLGSGRGEFGARPFIWGTLYSSILALLISTPIALGIAIFISELAPQWLRKPLVFLTELLAAIPVDRLRPLGHLRAGAAGPPVRTEYAGMVEEPAAVQRSSSRRRHAFRGHRSCRSW